MSRLLYLTIILLSMWTCQSGPKVYETFEDYPIYQGTDLGLTYTSKASIFKVWSPAVEAMQLKLYDAGLGGDPIQEESMKLNAEGVWEITLKGDWKGKYYAFQAKASDVWRDEVPDPYVQVVGTNGRRGMIVDMTETNPDGWDSDQRPPLAGFNDIIIYELHVRDVSMDPNSGIQNKGKFLGLAETGTTTIDGLST